MRTGHEKLSLRLGAMHQEDLPRLQTAELKLSLHVIGMGYRQVYLPNNNTVYILNRDSWVLSHHPGRNTVYIIAHPAQKRMVSAAGFVSKAR
jgi:hypothetical protein